MKLSAVTINKDPVEWNLEGIPHITYTAGYEAKWLLGESKSVHRIEYLARRRNGAVEQLYRTFPDTTHVLMVDSHYVSQVEPTNRLVRDYSATDKNGIVGGSSWCHSQYWPHRKIVFWDTWTTPEGMGYSYRDEGLFQVRAVGGAMIFPFEAWRTSKFDTSRFPKGTEINGFCENSRRPVFVDLYAKFLHPDPPLFGFVKTARVLKIRMYKAWV